LGVHHARGVALHTDPERVAELEDVAVFDTELSCELVHANLGWHGVICLRG